MSLSSDDRKVLSLGDLLPSRQDENYRYTQISFPVSKVATSEAQDWDAELLSNTETKKASFQALKSDFYEKAFEGVGSLSQVQIPENEDWVFLHSQGEGAKVLGGAELVVPQGKNVKVFELLDHASQKSLLMRNIRVEAGATLEYFLLQKQNFSNTFVLRHFLDLAPQSKATFRFFHSGAKKGQHRVFAKIAKEAKFTLEGATRLQNSQHVDIWAESEHVGPDSLSQTTVWNVLSDEAVAVFNGMIRIVPQCPQSQAYQSNKSLLLGEKSKVFTLPKLEIATDDVKCSHGASVSSLDATQLFYLQSRGIDKESAELMLVEAFTQPVLEHLPRHLLPGVVDGF